MNPVRSILLLATLFALSSCKREERSFSVSDPGAVPAEGVAMSALHPGPPATTQAFTLETTAGKYDNNAYAISQGKDLFRRYNCNGCHANGGGDIGPPLIDDKWIYGSQPAQIYSTIVQGRPNGMPSFAGRIQEDQMWQIVAYVRSLGGLSSPDASTGRDDHMATGQTENSRSTTKPIQSFSPKGGEMPQ